VSLALPDPRSVRALLLDAGGVLVRPDFERVAERLRAHGVAATAAGLAAAENRAKKRLDRPPLAQLPTDEQRGWDYFNLVLDEAGVPRSAATDAALVELKAFHDRFNAWDDVPDGVREALGRFRRLGLRLAVVSNANGTVPALLARLELAGFFDAVADSAIEGVEKPDPRLFQIALQRLGVEASSAVHVGDLYEVDVVGARRAGVRPVLLDADGLYAASDCPRVPSLGALATHLEAASAPRP
jgi:HAD superfamily hydrolase (TIGR01509 family)